MFQAFPLGGGGGGSNGRAGTETELSAYWYIFFFILIMGLLLRHWKINFLLSFFKLKYS